MSTTKSVRLPLSFAENAFAYSDFANFSGGTNLFKELVHYFLKAGEGKLHGNKVLSDTYDNTQAAKVRALVLFPTVRGGSDTVRFELAYRSSGDTDSGDPATAVETLATDFSVASLAAKTFKLLEFTLTPANLVAGKLVRYSLIRKSLAGGDNVNETAIVYALWLRANFT